MLYYTGTAAPNKPQVDPSQSLGGYISSSMVPNGAINNIFPPIDKRIVQAAEPELRLIAFKAINALTGLRIWTQRGTFSSLEIAAVTPAVDAFNNPIFEQVLNGQSIPYQATLAEADGEAAALSLGNIAAGAWIGIWIKRNIDQNAFTMLDGLSGISDLSDDDLEALIEASPSDAEDQAQLILDWQ